MRLLAAVMCTLIFCFGIARAECDPKYEEDLKPRVTSQISAALASACPNVPKSALSFEYFGSWTNADGDLVVQQVFFVSIAKQRTRAASCVEKIVRKLKADAREQVALRCGLLLAHEASWLPDADSGPSVLFKLREEGKSAIK